MATIKIKTSVSTLDATYVAGKSYELPDTQANQWVDAGIATMETASAPKPTRRKRK